MKTTRQQVNSLSHLVRKSIGLFLIASLIVFPAQMANPIPAGASTCSDTLTVTSDANSGPLSLRQELLDVCTGGKIDFDPSLSGSTIYLLSTLTIDRSVTIDASALAARVTLTTDTEFVNYGRVLQVNAGVTAILDNLRITHANVTGDGGGIYNQGNLTIRNSILFNNISSSNGGGIYNTGVLTVKDSSLLSNSASGSGGGGIYNDGGTVKVMNSILDGNSGSNASGGNGGGILNTNSLTIINSTLSNNTAYNAGGIYSENSLTILNSTLNGNMANNSNGYAGGIMNWGTAMVANSSLVGNLAGQWGGGIFNYGGTLTLKNSTLSGNSGYGSEGGGLASYNGTLNYANTIIANSPSGGDCISLSSSGGPGTIGTNINNLVENGACSASLSGDPNLVSLANNGGPTQTMALGAGSIAINAGDAATCAAAPVNGMDQRGVARPFGAACDIGAIEEAGSSVPTPFGKAKPKDGATGQSASVELSWQASAGASSYQYCYATSTGCTNWTSAETNTSVWLNSLNGNTTYFWQVRANNSEGTSYTNAGMYWSFTTAPIPPQAFSKTSPADIATKVATNPTLSWQASTGASSYWYCYSTSSGCTNWITTETATSIGLSGLENNKTYFWQVKASNPSGDTIANGGTYWSFTTELAAPQAFGKTSPTNGALNLPTDPDLSWQASVGATSYNICYATSTGCTPSTDVGNVTSTSLSSLVPGQTYFWQVQAVNADHTTEADSGTYWSFTVDDTAPVVNSITLPDYNPSVAPTLHFNVNFSEPVSGVDAGDFSLTKTGITGGAISGVSGSGATYSVTVTTGTGTGTIKLNLIDNDSIVDGAGYKLGGTGVGNGSYTSGPKYTLDRNNTFTSTATLDGWVLESSENSGLGGSLLTTGACRLGDDANNKQYRSLVSFATGALADNATITSVTLKIKKSAVNGTNPFTTHGLLLADIRKGNFGSLSSLQTADFKAAASKAPLGGSFELVGGSTSWYQLGLKPEDFTFINKTGITQFRLRFATDDNNDHGADFLSFFGGDTSTAANRPTLVVEYTLP